MPALYVYAIVAADHPCDISGLVAVGEPAGPLRRIDGSDGRLAAVVSDAPDDLRAKRRDLLRHEDVLEALGRKGTVLPMRFGVVSPDESTFLESLRRDSERYLQLVSELADRVEFNVKAFPDEDTMIASSATEAAVKKARDKARRHPTYDAQVRLGQLVADAIEVRHRSCADRVLGHLRPLAVQSAPATPVKGCALNAAFLVEEEAVKRFTAAVDQLQEESGSSVVLQLTGPLPPYSFVGTGS
jgi:hypothetical protein